MNKPLINKFFRILLYITGGFIFLLLILFVALYFIVQISPPEVHEVAIGERVQVEEHYFVLGDNYLRKNDFGIWEMYIEGDAYERGLIYGELAKELIQYQEDVFVEQFDRLVPNSLLQQFLRILIGFFNRNLADHIPLEYQQEIYGISTYFSDKHNNIGPKYMRILNYHAAHDIGHALNDYSVVGCTSFALKDERTENQGLLIGRNFDFYVGEAFAENKLIIFVNPTEGYRFASYSWPGFSGVVSGLNEQGLSVTINAAKSDLPTSSKTPVSILAREILQYAKNVDEAIEIAESRDLFVSETFLIGSAYDNKAILIEKSPTAMGVLRIDTNQLICTNHYQSERFLNDSVNLQNINMSDSKHRYIRVLELLSSSTVFTPVLAAEVLRDQHAEQGDTLGMGNPRAINQLIAHHSVIILPNELKFYVSTTDYQLGPFIAYDLQETFETKKGVITDTIESDPFVYRTEYTNFREFNRVKQKITDYLVFNEELTLTEEKIEYFIDLNSESYVTYVLIGQYFKKQQECQQANQYFAKALTKKLASKQVQLEIENQIETCQH